ncbi:nuclear transport factor 2 family protein [Streptomyces sp. MS2A]|nr:nuclear transport factor 2 family protein [Streptomyces sp. MS2A]
MAVIDPTRTWRPLEERLARTSDARHRAMLEVVIAHMKAEADGDLEALMATVSPDPQYHFWVGGADVGPKGRAAVRAYYAAFVGSRSNVLEYVIDRLVLDDETLVTEGTLKMIYRGAAAAAAGFAADDPDADYLVVARQLLLWPIDENGRVAGEDSYSDEPTRVTRLAGDELPQRYVDLAYGGVRP